MVIFYPSGEVAILPRLASITNAAASVDASQQTIRRWIARGLIHEYRLGPKTTRVDLDELEKWVRVGWERRRGADSAIRPNQLATRSGADRPRCPPVSSPPPPQPARRYEATEVAATRHLRRFLHSFGFAAQNSVTGLPERSAAGYAASDPRRRITSPIPARQWLAVSLVNKVRLKS